MSNRATAKTAAFAPDARAAALAFLHSLAAELSAGTVNLPCFPDVVFRIRKALANPNASLRETVRIVGTEPRLAARLLQAANSAAFNHSGKAVTDLRAAITRLGHRPVQSASMAFAVQQLRLAPALRSIAAPMKALWEESISVASISQVIARRTKVSPDEAFLTGLLHGIGRLYIMVRAVGRAETLCHDAAFMDLIDGWHPAIGKAVLENWGFDEEMSAALADQGDYERGRKGHADLTDILIVGVALALTLRDRVPRPVDMQAISSFQRMGLTEVDCAQVLQHTGHQLGALHAALGC